MCCSSILILHCSFLCQYKIMIIKQWKIKIAPKIKLNYNLYIKLYTFLVMSSLESTIDRQVEAFQKALYQHQHSTPDQKLYSSEEMRKFADKHSPGLFPKLMNCITGKRWESVTSKRRELQEQRVVSILHILAYFR